MPDFSTAISLLAKPIEDAYVTATGALKTKIAYLRTASKAKELHKKLWESQKVKTIWHTERPLSLGSFFYPASVFRSDGSINSPTRLNSLDDLPDNHNIIFGTAGQGKSILLRFLLGREIKSGIRIPVFCELRNIEDQSLEEYLCERFSLLLGIPADEEIYKAFAAGGKLSFLLDGFDEIDPTRVHPLMQEIEDLAYKYENCRIALTSRPESECRHLTSFHAYRVCPLTREDYEPFYKKISKDSHFTARLVSAINASPLQIRELLTTPLLATLLAISYRAAHKIPLDFAEFYEELFQILLVRHDGSKKGWRRHRSSKLDDREIQQIFEAFCFSTRRRQKTTIDRDNAFTYAEESIKECQIECSAISFLADIKKITCLLLEEGKKLAFVHASVQEFFSARYIKTRTDPVAEKIYQQFRQGKWENWQEELIFLQQIDPHRASKHFFLPDLEETLKDFLQNRSTISTELVNRYLQGMAVTKKLDIREGKTIANFYVAPIRKTKTQYYSILDQRVYSILFGPPRPKENRWSHGFITNPESTQRDYLQIATDRGPETLEKVSEVVTQIIYHFLSEKEKLSTTIKREESVSEFVEI